MAVPEPISILLLGGLILLFLLLVLRLRIIFFLRDIKRMPLEQFYKYLRVIDDQNLDKIVALLNKKRDDERFFEHYIVATSYKYLRKKKTDEAVSYMIDRRISSACAALLVNMALQEKYLLLAYKVAHKHFIELNKIPPAKSLDKLFYSLLKFGKIDELKSLITLEKSTQSSILSLIKKEYIIGALDIEYDEWERRILSLGLILTNSDEENSIPLEYKLDEEERVVDAPNDIPDKSIISILQKFVDNLNLVLVGHNIWWHDLRKLKNKGLKLNDKTRIVDSLLLSILAMPYLRSYALRSLAERFGLSYKPHLPVDDARISLHIARIACGILKEKKLLTYVPHIRPLSGILFLSPIMGYRRVQGSTINHNDLPISDKEGLFYNNAEVIVTPNPFQYISKRSTLIVYNRRRNIPKSVYWSPLRLIKSKAVPRNPVHKLAWIIVMSAIYDGVDDPELINFFLPNRRLRYRIIKYIEENYTSVRSAVPRRGIICVHYKDLFEVIKSALRENIVFDTIILLDGQFFEDYLLEVWLAFKDARSLVDPIKRIAKQVILALDLPDSMADYLKLFLGEKIKFEARESPIILHRPDDRIASYYQFSALVSYIRKNRNRRILIIVRNKYQQAYIHALLQSIEGVKIFSTHNLSYRKAIDLASLSNYCVVIARLNEALKGALYNIKFDEIIITNLKTYRSRNLISYLNRTKKRIDIIQYDIPRILIMIKALKQLFNAPRIVVFDKSTLNIFSELLGAFFGVRFKEVIIPLEIDEEVKKVPYSTIWKDISLAIKEADDIFSKLWSSGYKVSLRPYQRRVMAYLLAPYAGLWKRPIAFVMLPTGSGKSACFQVPAKLVHKIVGGVTIVVSPLLALIEDQVFSLREKGFRVRRLDSTISFSERQRVYYELLLNRVEILYVTPERFMDKEFRRLLPKLKINYIILDEVHTVSRWGKSFRPSYRYMMNEIREMLASEVPPPIIGFTATLPDSVLRDIFKLLGIDWQHKRVVRISFNEDYNTDELKNLKDCPIILKGPCIRPELTLNVIKASSRYAKEDILIKYVKEFSDWAKTVSEPWLGLIFVGYVKSSDIRDNADYVAELIEKKTGLKTVVYHGQLSRDEKYERLRKILMVSRGLEKEPRIIVATKAFGMGVDIPNIRFIIHYHPSDSIEDYYQEVGRGGRDRKETRCITIYTDFDIRKKVRLIKRNIMTINYFKRIASYLDRLALSASPSYKVVIRRYERVLRDVMESIMWRKISEEDAKIFLEKTLSMLREVGILDYEAYVRRPIKIVFRTSEDMKKILKTLREIPGLLIREFSDAVVIDESFINPLHLHILRRRGWIKKLYPYETMPRERMLRITFLKSIQKELQNPHALRDLTRMLLEEGGELYKFFGLIELFKQACKIEENNRDKFLKTSIEKYLLEPKIFERVPEYEKLKSRIKDIALQENLKDYHKEIIRVNDLEKAMRMTALKVLSLLVEGYDASKITIFLPPGHTRNRYLGLGFKELRDAIWERINYIANQLGISEAHGFILRPVFKTAKKEVNWLLPPVAILFLPELFSRNVYHIILDRLRLKETITCMIYCRDYERRIMREAKSKYKAWCTFIQKYERIRGIYK